jgi:hypothetical protein
MTLSLRTLALACAVIVTVGLVVAVVGVVRDEIEAPPPERAASPSKTGAAAAPEREGGRAIPPEEIGDLPRTTQAAPPERRRPMVPGAAPPESVGEIRRSRRAVVIRPPRARASSAPEEQVSDATMSADLRIYLRKRFSERPWYRHVTDAEVSGSSATMLTNYRSNLGRIAVLEMCVAVLSSGQGLRSVTVHDRMARSLGGCP